jgi:membrane protein implicated in regulation of membrane protease activity
MVNAEVIWLSVGVVLLLIEVTTGGFWVGFFGIGAIVVSVLAWLGVVEGINGQLGVFLIASVLPLVLTRRMLVRWLNQKTPDAPAIDAAGQTAVVVSEVGPQTVGRVEFQGSTWDAESAAGERLPEKTRVRIVRQDGTRLFVKAF